MMQYATPVKNLIFLARLELLLCHVRQRMWPRLFSVQNKTCSYFRVKLEPEIINCQNLKCCRVLYSYHLSSLMGNPTSSHGIPIRYTVGKGRTSSGNPGQKHNIGGGPFKPVRDPDIYIYNTAGWSVFSFFITYHDKANGKYVRVVLYYGVSASYRQSITCSTHAVQFVA